MHRCSQSIVLILFLTGCAGTGSKVNSYQTPESLAKMQWQACSHFPSVELVEITLHGKVLVRDSSYSSPPVDFDRCLASVAYQQVLDGDRNARSLVRDAYFIDARPERAYLYKPSGHFPEAVDQFTADQFVYFFFALDAPSAIPVYISSEWTSPSGEIIRKDPKSIVSKGAAARRWAVEQLNLPGKTKGRWSVKLLIENRDAGEYYFTVL